MLICITQIVKSKIMFDEIKKYKNKGEFLSELQNNMHFELSKGMTYVVSDELSSHRSTTRNGVKLLIIDGDFLKLK